MQIIPAIDIMDGQIVRLSRGDPSTKLSYEINNPLITALNWEEQGAEYIHIVDLDAALGKRSNIDIILEIASKLEIKIQVGGGIRNLTTALKLLDRGVERIIVGSMPIKTPETAKKLLEWYGPDRIVIALDHKDGYLMVKGWQESTELPLFVTLSNFIDQGFQWVLVTNIEHDGTFKGPDIQTYSQIPDKAKIIASGGVRSIDDINQLMQINVKAVVIGKALYERRFTLKEAMEATKC
jgi:phosphoribosylformimino-5-aminoimidazole carboxamide ribotide isomerase